MGCKMEIGIKKYIAEGGDHCPFCGGDNDVSGSQVNVEAGIASWRMHCLNCEKDWIDYYTLDRVAVSNCEGDLQVFDVNGEIKGG